MAKLIHGYQGGGDEWLNLGRLILLYCLFLFSEQVSAGQMDITAQTRVIHWTSQYNATGWAAKNVIDGQVGVNHEWASTINPTYPQEIVFKLASQQPLRSVAINPKSSESPSRWAKDIALLQASSENGPWQLLGSMTLSQTDSYQTLNVRGDTGQFVKLRIDSSWGGNYVEIGDMKLYVSDEQHDNLPSSPPSSPPGSSHLVDITAQTRVIHWTSQYNATGWAAKNVIDGQVGVNHEWASTINPTYPQEIVFKLASQQPLRSVAINPKSSESPSRWAKDIALLQASSENGPWQLLGSMTLSQTDSYQTLNVRGDTGQFVKLRIDSSWGGNYVEIGDMKLYADPISTGLETPSGQGGDEITIVNTRNIATVQNGPRQFFTFTLTQPMVITRINTYHWNSGDGTPSPGKVGIKGHGSWQAQGKPGMYDTPNAEWWVYPNVTLPAGKYTVTDSDAATWSQNDQSGGIGHCVVYGRVVN